MKKLLFILSFLILQTGLAQHCPWDCAGMILVQPDIVKTGLYALHPALVDENKRLVVDTIYGTGLNTFDTCRLLSFEDFTRGRTQKIKIHHWYAYDTVYQFAKGDYLVKFNYCKYRQARLYIRIDDPAKVGAFRYIEIPQEKRIHLHEYNQQLQQKKVAELKKLTQPFILPMKV